MIVRHASRIAARELRGGLAGFRILLICLALGVAAIAALGTVRAGIADGLAKEGAALLGGDAEVEFTYRFARPDESDWMASIADHVSETVDFRSMIVVERNTVERSLTQVRAVDDLYPLIGTVDLEPPMSLSDALAGTGAVMERVLADRLELAPGDRFRMGQTEFTLSAILQRYPDNAAAGFALGPRTIVRTRALDTSGLLAEGTLFSTQYRLNLPEGADLAQLETAAKNRFSDRGLRWRDSRNGAGGTARFVDRIGAFLILMGLAGLAVGGVGVSAAVRSYLDGKIKTIATLKTLGAQRSVIFWAYLLQIGAIAGLAVMLGLIIGGGVPVLLGPWIETRLPIPANFGISWPALAEAALYGVLTALIFTLWPLAKAERVKPASLFRGASDVGRLPSWPFLAALVSLVCLLVGAAIWLSGTVWLTAWTLGGIALALAALAVSARMVGWVARQLARRSRGTPALRLATGAIGASNGETTAVVLSLGLGLSVLAAVGQIDGNLRLSFDQELPKVAPSYFFVDIQPEQIDGFQARLDGDPDVSKVDTAPMLRGIISRINGQPAAEFSGPHWVLRGDRGLTYAAGPPIDAKLTQGRWWDEDYNGPPLLSFAAEEATELGLSLGDEVTVNILGRDITAKIANFQHVSWDSAGIGFVMTMNKAALAGAPHSWIATVYAQEQAEAAILRDLANAYPNITAIRIRDAIEQVSELVEGISAATRYGALVTLITGFFVLVGAALAGERQRTYEAAILKTLGASKARILSSFALRAAFLGLGAGVVALAAGLAGGWAVTTFVMENDFHVIWSNAVAVVIGGIAVSTVAGLLFAIRPLSARPARVLRAAD